MEGTPNNESVDRGQLVELLKTKGFEDHETQRILNAWTKEQEDLVESLGIREARITFELNRAQLYFDSGFMQDSMQALHDALYVAQQENLSDQIKLVEDKMGELFF